MGSAASYEMNPQELAEFRKLNPTGRIDTFEIPERAENRVATNKKYSVLLAVCLTVLLCLIIFCCVKSDTKIITKPYDDCGNFCGIQNKKWDDFGCSGKDMTSEPYMEYIFLNGHAKRHGCVEICDGEIDDGKCFQGKVKDLTSIEIGTVSNSIWWRIVLAIIISIAVSAGVMMLFRFATKIVVWTILIGTITIFLLAAIGAIILYCTSNPVTMEEKNGMQNLLIMGIFCGIVGLIFACITIFLRRRVQLVVQVMKEAISAITSMPTLLSIPVLTSLVEVVVIVIAIILSGVIYCYAHLVRAEDEEGRTVITYQPTGFAVGTLIFNLIMVLWLLQLIVGAQYMIIAGAISNWYFAKNKRFLNSPVWNSTYITFRFHFGTLAVGSLIITLFSIFRVIIRSAFKNQLARAIVECCLKTVEDLLKFLTKNAYIITAMHGQSFYKSGKRAAKLIVANVVNIAAVNSVGDFVMGIAALLTIIIAMGINYVIFMSLPPEELTIGMVITLIITVFIVCCFFSLYETAIDSIFICFCEDTVINDGMARPYCMSRGLMEFMDNSKAILGENKKK